MKRYDSPVFNDVKYDDEDIILLSDNKELDGEDSTGLGGMNNIDP